MTMLSNVDLIRRIPLFAHLTPEQMESLAGTITKKRLKRGQHLVKQGETSNSLNIILVGRARVVMTDRKGREVILATLKAGDYIGEMSLIDNLAHSASVEAEAPTDVLLLGREQFMQCLEANTSMALAVMQGLVQRLRSADQKIGSLALSGVYTRVANVLLDAAVADADGTRVIPEKISRQDIAKMVGASREMVSRVMKDFEEQGFIEPPLQGWLRVNDRRIDTR
jgi:CRP/FNR family transcriptional regulator, cyclic AMP receptor protein